MFACKQYDTALGGAACACGFGMIGLTVASFNALRYAEVIAAAA
jgi:hypothetical protein